jgi:hypothetical protein
MCLGEVSDRALEAVQQVPAVVIVAHHQHHAHVRLLLHDRLQLLRAVRIPAQHALVYIAHALPLPMRLSVAARRHKHDEREEPRSHRECRRGAAAVARLCPLPSHRVLLPPHHHQLDVPWTEEFKVHEQGAPPPGAGFATACR